MNDPSQPTGHPPSSAATCEHCLLSIKENSRHDAVVCVPHLKSIPINSLACDLFSIKIKKP